MTKEAFLAKLSSLSGNELGIFIGQFSKSKIEIDQYLREYDPLQHDIFDKVRRPDKLVRKPSGQLNPDGTQIMLSMSQAVTRIAVDIQQEVTKNAAGILCTKKIELKNTSKNVVGEWDNNRLDLKTISMCSIWLSETEVAELWYKKDGELKVLVLANGLGDTLYPVFDDFGDLICFGRKYQAQVIIEGTDELQTANYFEIYTDTQVIKGTDNASDIFSFDSAQPHGFTEIPVIYATRKLPIWSNVQTSISRFETSISNLCDTNDYFGSPTAVVKGKIVSYADKGESGKILQIDPQDPNAKIEYLTWNQAPESLKLEWEKLMKIVMDSTRTVSLSVENLKGLFGSAPSAYAIKLLFTPAHMQAAEHEEVFGEYVQRRLNFLAKAISGTPGKPEFNYFLPKNDFEEVNLLNSALSAGIVSHETAIEDSPLTVDAEKEKARIKTDEAEAQAQFDKQQEAVVKVNGQTQGQKDRQNQQKRDF